MFHEDSCFDRCLRLPPTPKKTPAASSQEATGPSSLLPCLVPSRRAGSRKDHAGQSFLCNTRRQAARKQPNLQPCPSIQLRSGGSYLPPGPLQTTSSSSSLR